MILSDLSRDVRYAWRGLRRDRAFTLTTVATLSVALALVTTVFAVFNAYVLRPYAVRDPYSLYEIRWTSREAGGRAFRWQDYEELRRRTDLFDSAIAERHRPVMSGAERLVAAFVSGNYFESLGGRIALGRALASFDAPAPGSQAVAVLSDQGWARLFDRDPSALGRELRVNGQPLLVVGVMAKEFSGINDSPPDLWVPVTMHAAIVRQDLFAHPQPRELAIVARLRPGITERQAEAALTTFTAEAVERTDAVRPELLPQATPAPLTLELIAILSPVFGAFLIVLVAACANVSNLMLARAIARGRDISVRLSLGASRRRIVRELLTEGLLLSMLGAVGGLVLAALLLRTGLTVFFDTLPPTAAAMTRVLPLDFDYRVLAFSLAAAGVTTIMFALLPSLEATRASLMSALRGEVGPGVRASKLRGILIAGQVALSLVLLVGAATLVRTSSFAAATDLGFNPQPLISVNQRGTGNSLISRTAAELTNDPRVERVAVTSRNPLFGELPKAPIRRPDSVEIVPTSYMFVSPEYFETLGIAIERGRGFHDDEARAEARVGILSAAAARRFWPAADPIGKTLRVWIAPEQRGDIAIVHKRIGTGEIEQQSVDVTIVGVASDVVNTFIYTGKDAAHLYMPTSAGAPHANAILLRARAGGGLQPHMLQPLSDRVDPNPLALEAITLNEMVEIQLFPVRVASWVGVVLSGVALALSVSGLYGVVAYALSHRRKEIGIRMALGATSGAVVRLLMRQSGRLAVAGCAIGLVLALGAMGTLRAFVQLGNVAILDPGAFAASVLLIGAAAGFATWIPARRAGQSGRDVESGWMKGQRQAEAGRSWNPGARGQEHPSSKLPARDPSS